MKVGLTDPPASMRLGSTVNGTAQFNAADMISVPASALTELNRQPSVWIVDPKKKLTVSMRNISVARFDPGTVVVAGRGAIRFYLPLDVQLPNDFFSQLVIVAKDVFSLSSAFWP